MMKTLIVLISLVLYSHSFAQTQYFTDESSWRLPDTAVFSNGSTIGDIDSDGDLDICIAHDWPYMGPLYLIVNNGSGVFANETANRLPLAYDFQQNCTFGDIDNDGDLDLYVPTNGPGNARNDYLYVNIGLGYFEDQTIFRLPDVEFGTNNAILADFDEDYYLDIIVQAGMGPYPTTRLYLNDTQGVFEDVSSTHLPDDIGHNRYIMTLDIDNDLDLDIIESYSEGVFYGARLLKNLGQGYFTDQSQNQFYANHVTNFEPGDIDIDGDLDFITYNSGQINIWINEENGFYSDQADLRLPDNYNPSRIGSMALGDYDNDGDLDLFIGRTIMSTAHLLINDGQGYFAIGNERLPDSVQSAYWIENFDADGDGDLDIFMPCQGDGRPKIYINHSTPDTIPPNILAKTIYYQVLDSAEYYPVRISAWDNISRALGELKGNLYFRVNSGSFSQIPLLPLGGTIFGERIPGQSIGTHIEFYYEMIDRMGNTTLVPDSSPDSVYGFWVEEITGVNSDEVLPLSKEILIAYPNPFNAQTVISYSLSQPNEVNLSIYNIMGQRVTTLSDGAKEAGEHSIVWNADDVPSGIYFARLEVENRAENIKMVLLK